MEPPPPHLKQARLDVFSKFTSLIKNTWDLLDTYAFLATFSYTVSSQEVSNCKGVGPSIRLSVCHKIVSAL